MIYCGRFAPSPTGPLHLGSLTTALGSWLDAQHHGGEWFIRVDDIDPPRETVDKQHFTEVLARHGLEPSKQILQSHRVDRYRAALKRLPVFDCTCSRAEIKRRGGHGPACESGPTPAKRAFLNPLHIADALAGTSDYNFTEPTLLWRKEDWPSYHLACAVDDAELGVTHVVRGHDLWHETPVQQSIIQTLGANLPRYAHLPLVTNELGQKLSKQNLAEPLDAKSPRENLRLACRHLMGAELNGSVSDILDQALNLWRSPWSG